MFVKTWLMDRIGANLEPFCGRYWIFWLTTRRQAGSRSRQRGSGSIRCRPSPCRQGMPTARPCPPATAFDFRRHLARGRAPAWRSSPSPAPRPIASCSSAPIDVLKATSASPGDPQPVFDLIVRRARELCDTNTAALYEFDGELVHLRSIVYQGAPLPSQPVASDPFSRS